MTQDATGTDEGFWGAFASMWHWVPLVVAIAVVLGGLVIADRVLLRGKQVSVEHRVPRQLAMVLLSVFGVIWMVLALPSETHGGVSDATRGNLLGLIGLGVTALLTLSSTTLAANGMAGLMLRATAPFRGGDWVRVGEHFGRVTERGLFHTEIQTEDRDLVTLPNLFLATNPVRIVHPAGTVVSAEVSIGYEVSHAEVEELLVRAAEATGLEDPFVWLTSLLDHAVVYRVAGTLTEVKSLISVRSRLRANVLDTLHEGGVEIASPSLMIQRRGELTDVAIPRSSRRARRRTADGSVEERLFDKAEEAAKLVDLRAEIERIEGRLAEIGAERKAEGGSESLDAEADRLERELADAQGALREELDAEPER